MAIYLVEVFDITVITNKKKLDEFQIEANDKNEAIDKAHIRSIELHPNVNKFLQTREISSY